jgi:hypothetical protein
MFCRAMGRIYSVRRLTLGELFISDPNIPAGLREEIERAADYARLQHAGSTIDAYERDWNIFTRWCKERALPPLPATPQIVATFLAHEA